MTQLRILAPVLVDYYAVPGATLRDPVGYAKPGPVSSPQWTS